MKVVRPGEGVRQVSTLYMFTLGVYVGLGEGGGDREWRVISPGVVRQEAEVARGV